MNLVWGFPVLFGMPRSVLAVSGLGWPCLVLPDLARSSLGWPILAWAGLGCSSLVWDGLLSGLVLFGLVVTC